MRRFGEAIRPGVAYRRRPGAYAVIRDGDDVLLTEQSQPARELQLPGGGVDPGESVLAALRRECFEETGWGLAVVRKLGVYQRFAYLPEYGFWAQKICHVFLARPTRRRGLPSEPHHRPLWVPIATAADLVAGAGDRAFLRAAARAGR